MPAVGGEATAYELLGVVQDVSDGDLRKAYRQQSLKSHPDRHPDDPNAAQKFHELTQAYELLQDPVRRLALDATIRIKEARNNRFAALDHKRKVEVEELEERERVFKRQKEDKARHETVEQLEVDRIKEEGRKRMRMKAEELSEKAAALAPTQTGRTNSVESGPLDTTIRLKYALAEHPTLISPPAISSALQSFGAIDTDSIVLSMKPSKKNPTKPPKFVTALVPFRTVSQAFGAVTASGTGALKGIEASWAAGAEPAVVNWLKVSGHLGSTPPAGGSGETKPVSPAPGKSSDPFSSFPESFSFDPTPSSGSPKTAQPIGGIDYESLTLMRLRQAERERLEREIRESEE